MRVSKKVCVAGAVVLVAGCLACYTLPLGSDTAQPPTLFETERPAMFGALRQFLNVSGAKLEQDFVSLRQREDGLPAFAEIPKGWSIWKEEKYKDKLIFLDQSDFRLYIEIEATGAVESELWSHIQSGQRYGSIVVLDHLFMSDGEDIVRIAKHEKGKGNTHFKEARYFDNGRRVVRVELSVVDELGKNKTVSDLLIFLRTHYGKYEWVCAQVARAMFVRK
jgi:hypothetical protein